MSDKKLKFRKREYKSSYDVCSNPLKTIIEYNLVCQLVEESNILRDDQYVFKKIAKGGSGEIYLVCSYLKENCNEIVKVIYNPNRNKFRKEVANQSYFYNIGLSPPIKEYYYIPYQNEIYGIILMDRVDSTVKDYLNKKRTKKEIKSLIDALDFLLVELQENRIVHGDFHFSNIGLVIEKDGTYPYLLDFEYSQSETDNDITDIAQLIRTTKYFYDSTQNKKEITKAIRSLTEKKVGKEVSDFLWQSSSKELNLYRIKGFIDNLKFQKFLRNNEL